MSSLLAHWGTIRGEIEGWILAYQVRNSVLLSVKIVFLAVKMAKGCVNPFNEF
ncbi:MAG: hypothetical protein OSB19_03980 [Opitutaceae bacterium]|nr:hypothetical protein [Opitutaceae bacterium]